MVMWYWSTNTLFWQVWIDHNMDVQYQRMLYKSRFNLLAGVWLQSCMTTPLRCCHHSACVPTSNTSHDNHEKINSWVSFFSYMRMGLCLKALWATGAPLSTETSIGIQDVDLFNTDHEYESIFKHGCFVSGERFCCYDLAHISHNKSKIRSRQLLFSVKFIVRLILWLILWEKLWPVRIISHLAVHSSG